VRILDLTKRFSANRRIYAPPGSLEDRAMRRELARLASERSTLPLAGDEDALRTPLVVLWGHPVPGTNLVITYEISLPSVVVHDVRPAWRAV
jgi:hypothetical protein